MEGSERRIVTFARRRAEAVGLEVIPGDKWTRPVESTSPASVLYVDGSTDLYLRPFYQQEYNDLFYEKLRRNDAKGNPGLMKWVRIQQVPGAALAVSAGTARSRTAEPRLVQEEPFVVEQIPGGALGYRIMPSIPTARTKAANRRCARFTSPCLPGSRSCICASTTATARCCRPATARCASSPRPPTAGSPSCWPPSRCSPWSPPWPSAPVA